MLNSFKKKKAISVYPKQNQPGIHVCFCSLYGSVSGNPVRMSNAFYGVAPGPIWTPLIPATFPPTDVASFGTDVPLGRAGQPEETAPCYVFLASDDSSYMTGQILHPNGGEIVNG